MCICALRENPRKSAPSPPPLNLGDRNQHPYAATQNPLIKSLPALTALATTIAPVVAGIETKSTIAPATDSGWQADLNAGFSLTRGNSDKLGLSLGLDAERKWDLWQVIGKGAYNYTEVEASRPATPSASDCNSIGI